MQNISINHIYKYRRIIDECKQVATLKTLQTFVSIATLLSTIKDDLYGEGQDHINFKRMIDTYLTPNLQNQDNINRLISLYNMRHPNSREPVTFGTILYKLRCKLVHNDRPNEYFYIAHSADNPPEHLSYHDNKLVLIAEELLKDIEKMVNNLEVRDTVTNIETTNTETINIHEFGENSIASGILYRN